MPVLTGIKRKAERTGRRKRGREIGEIQDRVRFDAGAIVARTCFAGSRHSQRSYLRLRSIFHPKITPAMHPMGPVMKTPSRPQRLLAFSPEQA